jgi:hypothetical protein
MSRLSNVSLTAIVLAALFAVETHAQSFTMQPRISVGQQDYEFKYDDQVLGNDQGFVNASDGFTVSDKVQYLGTGITVSHGRLFVDLSGQWSGHGSDQTRQFIGSPTVLGGGLTHQLDFKFDRSEYNVSAGWAATPNFSFYVGYKDAATNLTTRLTPILAGVNINQLYIFGSRVGKLTYGGLYLGSTYSVPVSSWGSLSIQSSVASLDGKSVVHFEGLGVFYSDLTFPPTFLRPIDPAFINGTLRGKAVGLNLGVSWTGSFGRSSDPPRKLSYTIGLDRSAYKFDSKGNSSDFEETVTRARFDLRYRFEF